MAGIQAEQFYRMDELIKTPSNYEGDPCGLPAVDIHTAFGVDKIQAIILKPPDNGEDLRSVDICHDICECIKEGKNRPGEMICPETSQNMSINQPDVNLSPSAAGNALMVHQQAETSTQAIRDLSSRDVNSDEDCEDETHSGTSMLRSKKKRRSRLKRFLTSLLSLSSSSDEENYDGNRSVMAS